MCMPGWGGGGGGSGRAVGEQGTGRLSRWLLGTCLSSPKSLKVHYCNHTGMGKGRQVEPGSINCCMEKGTVPCSLPFGRLHVIMFVVFVKTKLGEPGESGLGKAGAAPGRQACPAQQKAGGSPKCLAAKSHGKGQ